MSRSLRILTIAAIAALFVVRLSVDLSDPPPARAVTATVVYDPTDLKGVNPCAPVQMKVCSGGVDQTPQALEMVEAAAAFWTDVIEDGHDMTILVSWYDPALSSDPEASPVETDDQGRVTVGRVRLIPDKFTYYYDPTPTLDEEFLGRRTDSGSRLLSGMMRPKLNRTVHPEEKAQAFLNTGSEIVEIGYNGLVQPDIGTDLFTHALHEVGHLFGLISPISTRTCDPAAANPGYSVPASLSDSMGLLISAAQLSNDKIDCGHIEAGGITACKPPGTPSGAEGNLSPEPSTLAGLSIHDCTSHQAVMWPSEYPGGRTRPSIVDILATAVAEDWQQVDLPRKYSLGAGGSWTADGTWFGNRAPDSGDDVYVVNQQHAGEPFTTVTTNGNRSARNLFISDENRVQVNAGTLTIGRTVWLAGPDSREGPVRPILPPPAGPPPLGQEPALSTLLVRGGGTVIGDRLGVEPEARLRFEGNGQAQFGDVINSGSIQGRGLLGVTRSLMNGITAGENGTGQDDTPKPASGIIRADGGLLRIVSPQGGGVTTDPPSVDLDGPTPLTTATPARVWGIDGDIEIDAPVANTPAFLDGFCLDMRIGAGRTVRLVRSGITLNNCNANDVTYGLRFEGGAAGATFDAPPSTFHGNVVVDGIGLFAGRTTFDGGARVQLALGGTTAGTQHDQLRFQQVAELGGTLQVSLKDGFTPQSGQSFTVMTYGSRMGEFDTVSLPPLPFGLLWKVEYDTTALRLVVSANVTTDPGGPEIDTDIDDDGASDALDLLAILQHFGPCPAQPAACPWDLNDDGVVNNDDVLLWLENA